MSSAVSSSPWPSLATVWRAIALLLPVTVALAVPPSAVDLAYAVRAGRLILERGDVLRTDPFTFTAGGEAWIDQQWLAQVAFALVHDAAGWAGLALLRGALVGLIVLLLADTLRRSGLDARRAGVLTLAAFVVVAPSLALRAQLFAVVLFALTLWLLAVTDTRPALRWLLVPIASLWANLHGTFVLLPAAVGVGWLTGRSFRGRAGVPSPSDPGLLLLIGTFLATLVNPFGVAVWEYALGLATNPIVAGLATEWQPTSAATVPGALFLAALAVVAVLLVRGPRRPAWPTIVWLVALAVLALRAERAVVWWALAAAVALGPTLARSTPPAGLARRSLLNAAIVLGLVLASLAALPWWRADPSGDPGPLLADAPVDLTDELTGRVEPDTRAYVSQPWASWVEFALPEVRTFVDSRFEVAPEAAWEDYVAIAAVAPDWQARLDRWGIELVIVDRTREPNLAAALDASPDWRRLAVDPASNGAAYGRLSRSGGRWEPAPAVARPPAPGGPGGGRTS
ncbi:MAG TPA: hypothetical protein VNO86_00140 [Candidatus Binatia bacterium]|nr:hypothetical protein [Candidatus Binatia bacterium]